MDKRTAGTMMCRAVLLQTDGRAQVRRVWGNKKVSIEQWLTVDRRFGVNVIMNVDPHIVPEQYH